MLFEESFECHSRCLPCFVWLAVQQPRTLADERREFGSLSRIIPKIER